MQKRKKSVLAMLASFMILANLVMPSFSMAAVQGSQVPTFHGIKNITVSPNPFDPEVDGTINFKYDFSNLTSTSLLSEKIYYTHPLQGKKIIHTWPTSSPTGSNSVDLSWNGKDVNNMPYDAGDYYFEVTGHDSTATFAPAPVMFTIKKKVVLIPQPTPTPTPDVTAPVLKEVTPIADPTTNTKPTYTFSSTEAGTITYGGDCSSSTTNAVASNNTVTLNTLTVGKTYSNCTVMVTDLSSNKNKSAPLKINTFKVTGMSIIDIVPPVLTKVAGISSTTTETTPSYTFHSTEAGTITYGGDCSSLTTTATATNNTIKLDAPVTHNPLTVGKTYSNCTITVTDLSSNKNKSAPLAVDTFKVVKVSLLDTTAPVISNVMSVPSSTSDTTPNYTFHSTESGDTLYGGDCDSTDTSAVAGDNTVTFDALSYGLHSNCSVRVRDDAGNVSNTLDVNDFTVSSTIIVQPSNPAEYCVGFTDISKNDPDCSGAFTFVKNNKIFTGHPDGSFGPDEYLQRDQVAKVVLEAFKRYKAGVDYCKNVSLWSDIFSTTWSRQYLCLGKTTMVNGQYLLTGYKSGKNVFLPGNAVNRSEFLAIVLRNLKESMPSADTYSYSDVQLGQWDSPFAAFAAQHLDSIYPQPYLSRTSFVTRYEAAKVLYELHRQGML